MLVHPEDLVEVVGIVANAAGAPGAIRGAARGPVVIRKLPGLLLPSIAPLPRLPPAAGGGMT
ncbi:MAG: hypothetical protein EXR72_20715 [Myxococcales bacterium]|nr:hypothetical protein [Myxococcales bacterium]